MTISLILLLVVVLLASAFFSAAETALTGASRARMHRLAKEGNKRAKTVNNLRKDSEHLISALLLGNNFLNNLGTALTTVALTSMVGDEGVIYATAVMTIAILIFAEVLPKTFAFGQPDRLALVLAPVVRLWLYLCYPITVVVRWLTIPLLKLMTRQHATLGQQLSDDELRGAIDLHGMEGSTAENKQERAMLRNILDLADVSVSQVMTHRRNVEAYDVEEDKLVVIDAILASGHTRVPMWRDQAGNIIGILHAKALLRALNQQAKEDINLESLLTPPWFIPETANLLDQLQAFRARREHFALVVDEYGDFRGIVTLEDILEEIVGDIDDELDAPVTGVRRSPDGKHYLVQGEVALRDLNREFDWNLPSDDATTLAGLMLHAARKIPDVGQVFMFYDFRFEILRRQRNQLTLIRVTPPEA